MTQEPQTFNAFIKIFQKARNVAVNTDGIQKEDLDATIRILLPKDVEALENGKSKADKASILLDLLQLAGMTPIGVFMLNDNIYVMGIEHLTIFGFNVNNFENRKFFLEEKIVTNIAKKMNIAKEKVALVELKPGEQLLPELPLSSGKPN